MTVHWEQCSAFGPCLTAQQTRSHQGNASSAPGCPSARHSLPVMSGCSVVQKGASSACLNCLSLGARDQLSSAGLSTAQPRVDVQCAPADCHQREGLCPAVVHMGRLLHYLERARLQDLHGPTSASQGVRCVPSVRSGAGPAAMPNRVPRHTCAGSSSRRTALGRAARLGVRALMLRCSV